MHDIARILSLIHVVGFSVTATCFIVFSIWDRRCNDGDWTILTVCTRVILLSVVWPVVFVAPVLVWRDRKRAATGADD